MRGFSTSDKPEIPEDELKKQLIPLYWVRGSRRLSTEPGMHRWIWHLHYAAPASMRHEYPIAAVPHDTPRGPSGPTVVPGTYKVQLTVDGKSLTAPLTVKMDPRVKTPLAALQKKEQAETRQAAIMTQTTQALLQANSIRSQLEKLSANDATKNALADFQKKLSLDKSIPAGSIEYGGLFLQQQESFRNLALVLALAIFLVFSVLLIEFGSFYEPIAIVAGALLAMSGAVFGLWITGATLNVDGGHSA